MRRRKDRGIEELRRLRSEKRMIRYIKVRKGECEIVESVAERSEDRSYDDTWRT